MLDENFEEPLRRRRNEAELTQVLQARFPTPGDVAKVIDEFVAAGLLRRFGEGPNGQLEVAHEALLRHWDHIYRLVTGAEIKERLHLVKQIGREASDWVGHEQVARLPQPEGRASGSCDLLRRGRLAGRSGGDGVRRRLQRSGSDGAAQGTTG